MNITETVEAPGLRDWLKNQVESYGNIDEFAVKAKVSISYLYALKSGRRKCISRKLLSKIEDALGVKYD